MRRLLASVVLDILLVALLYIIMPVTTTSAQAQSLPEIAMLNQAGERVTILSDGALVRFEVTVAEAATEPITYSLHLDERAHEVATCTILAGAASCTTAPVGTLGWYWQAGSVIPTRTIHVAETTPEGWLSLASLAVTVRPRPVVMVHGFGADYTTWLSYLGPSGYLALAGLRGFAVGDGQVPGTMHTGSLFNPTLRTNTIARNAQVLGDYIASVKALTGAEQVDLIVHSMGGLISRYYIARVMGERDVAQLIMLGTPNGGSNCAVMIGTLGLFQPAGLELREDYIRNVFNPQITEQHGIPFYNFAGTPIQRRLLSPCSEVPNDLVVSLESAALTPVTLAEVPILHTDLNTSRELFEERVLPLLRKSPADFVIQGAQPTPRATLDDEPVQYSQVFTGVVTVDVSQTHTIHIDSNVAVASFGLYDPSRTLTVTVRGASGNVITLTPDLHGLTVVDDPAALLYLGYGFENPRPGPWQVTVHTTPRTPPLGAEYAIMTQYVGGAVVEAALSNQLPGLEEEVVLTATLNVGDEPVAIAEAEVTLIGPNGAAQALELVTSGNVITATFQPVAAGIHGIDVHVVAVLPDGSTATRSNYLALEAFTVAPERRE